MVYLVYVLVLFVLCVGLLIHGLLYINIKFRKDPMSSDALSHRMLNYSLWVIWDIAKIVEEFAFRDSPRMIWVIVFAVLGGFQYLAYLGLKAKHNELYPSKD